MQKVVKFWSRLLDKIETDVTLELDELEFSEKHGHEICVMHLIGKNIFPKMTAEEILSNPKARAGLSKDDLITITRLDMEIRLKKGRMRLVEMDRNGTLTLKNDLGEVKRYSEKYISMNNDLLKCLGGQDGYMVGYRVGFKDGRNIATQKERAFAKIRSFFNLSKKL